MAPSNFAATNPEVLAKTMETGGENLLSGLTNLLDDLQRGKGRLSVTMTDMNAFRLGENVATTPGKVVFQNEMMQLIQYEPTTETVRKTPLLIIPPWINKFYVLDLQPKNSFIRWCVAQGHTVFVISWVNPDEKLRDKNFEDYMLEGPIAAMDAIERATGEREVNAVGYCLGGTLLASTLGWLAAKGDERIRSATYFVTLVDFEVSGELVRLHGHGAGESPRGADEREGLSRSPRHGAIVQHAARQRPDLVLRRLELSARQGADALRPAVLERRCDAYAGGHAVLLPPQHVQREQSPEAGRHLRSRASRSTCARSPRRRSSSARRRITSRRGFRPTRRPSFTAVRWNSSCRPPGTWPA